MQKQHFRGRSQSLMELTFGVPSGSWRDFAIINVISEFSREGNGGSSPWRIEQLFQPPGMILCSEMHPSFCLGRVHGLLLQASAFALVNRANDRCKLAEPRHSLL